MKRFATGPDVGAVSSFDKTFDRAMISVLRATKFTKRGDLWRAQHVLGLIRQSLLQFIEWHTLVTRATPVDTWYPQLGLTLFSACGLDEACLNDQYPDFTKWQSVGHGGDVPQAHLVISLEASPQQLLETVWKPCR